MPQCRYCGRKGFFLSLTPEGLCNECLAMIRIDVVQRVRIIQESESIISRSSNFKTKLSRIDLVISHLNELRKYEDRQIQTIGSSPSQLLLKTEETKRRIIGEEANLVFEKAFEKSDLAMTLSSKLGPIIKAVESIRNLRHISDSDNLKEMETKLKQRIHEIKLEDFVERAQKAEFKGDIKRAIDQYQEALYFLRNDDVPDSNQTVEIENLEKKIRTLRGDKEA